MMSIDLKKENCYSWGYQAATNKEAVQWRSGVIQISISNSKLVFISSPWNASVHRCSFRCVLVQGPPAGCIQPEYRLPMQPIGFRCRGPMWMSDETPLPAIHKEEGINAGDRIDSNGLLNNRIGKILMVNILWSYFKYGP